MNVKISTLLISTLFFFNASTTVSDLTFAGANNDNLDKAATQRALETPESTASKPTQTVDPRPKIIKLIGGKTMFMAIEADGAGLWRTPGVIVRKQEIFDSDLVNPVKAELGKDSRPLQPAGFSVIHRYITRDVSKIVVVETIYREDGWMEPPVVSHIGGNAPENRTTVLPLNGGKSALVVKNQWGQSPILAGIYDSDLISKASPNLASSQEGADGFKAHELRIMRAADGGALCFGILYRANGSFEPPHVWKAIGTGEIENRTQVIELNGGESALLLADPKDKNPLLKGIYPDNQLNQRQSSSGGILLTEQYLTVEGEILSLDTLYPPEKRARFVGGRLGDKPIQNRNQVIKLAGSRSAVFTADPRPADSVPQFAGIRDAKGNLGTSVIK